jgi:hypothetical protein
MDPAAEIRLLWLQFVAKLLENSADHAKDISGKFRCSINRFHL